MFLNLSNHPSEKWSVAQRTAAESEYGEIIDIPFPHVPPAATCEEVQQLAVEYGFKVRATEAETVHLMGEMTFTFVLVKILQYFKIKCVASTSERKSIENADGTKTIQFDFVQFRAY